MIVHLGCDGKVSHSKYFAWFSFSDGKECFTYSNFDGEYYSEKIDQTIILALIRRINRKYGPNSHCIIWTWGGSEYRVLRELLTTVDKDYSDRISVVDLQRFFGGISLTNGYREHVKGSMPIINFNNREEKDACKIRDILECVFNPPRSYKTNIEYLRSVFNSL